MTRVGVSVLTLGLAGCTGPHQLSVSGAGAYEASLATSPRRAAVAWFDTRDGNAEIYARRIDRRGRAWGGEHRLTNDSAQSYEADIVAAGDGFAVAWYEHAASGTSRAKLGLWSEAFEPRWTISLSRAGTDGRIPVVRVFEDRIFCAWLETPPDAAPEVRAGWWDLEGQVLVESQRLGAAGSTTWNLNAAIDAHGLAYVLFDARAGTRSEEIFLALVDGARSQLVRLSADDDLASKYPDLALASEHVAVTWFDERDGNREVYLLVVPVAELNERAIVRALRVTETPGESIGAYVAWNGDRVGLAWSDDSAGQHEVHFRTFDSTGNVLTDTQRLTYTATASLIPAIQSWADGFMLAWNEVAADPRGIHGPDTRSEIMGVFVR